VNSTLNALLDTVSDNYLLQPAFHSSAFPGEIGFSRLSICPKFESLDHIVPRMNVRFVTAIDFNCYPYHASHPDWPHFVGSEYPTNCELCLRALASTLYPYAANQELTVFGHSASMRNWSMTSSGILPLSFDRTRPSLGGIEDIVAAYREAASCASGYSSLAEVGVVQEEFKQAERIWDESETFTVVLLLVQYQPSALVQNPIRKMMKGLDKPMSVFFVNFGDKNRSSPTVYPEERTLERLARNRH
jgi:hypothetical protein